MQRLGLIKLVRRQKTEVALPDRFNAQEGQAATDGVRRNGPARSQICHWKKRISH